jgi:lipoyl(octanoyl) transferase
MSLQQKMVAERQDNIIPDTLLLLDHPPTYTLGLRGKAEHIRVSMDFLRQNGIEFFQTDRGGDVTFHGPGQLVGYPIIHMESLGDDIRQYVRRLEGIIMKGLSAFGINSWHEPGYPGVWIQDKKIAAIGIKVNAAGIASHGFGLNVNTDLSYFNHILPCGLDHKSVTSMAQILKRPVSMGQVVKILSEIFIRTFG